MIPRFRKLLLALVVPLLFLGCEELAGLVPDNPTIILDAACSGNATFTGSRVLLACNTVNGNLVSIDVIGADISSEFDGYNIHISFSPGSFRYTGFVTTAHPFTPPCNDPGGLLLCSDNLAAANTSGLVVYSVTLTGANPTGVTIGTGNQAVLGTLMFEAVSVSSTSPVFSAPISTQMCVGPTTSGAALTAMDPIICPLGVTTVGGVSWDNASLLLPATEQP